jgi:hypothetical protein
MKLYKGQSSVDRQTGRQIEDKEEKNTRKKKSRIGIQAAALGI